MPHLSLPLIDGTAKWGWPTNLQIFESNEPPTHKKKGEPLALNKCLGTL